MSLQAEFARAARDGDRAALVTVVASEHPGVSVGAKALVRPDETVEGSLGHPQLDAAALDFADELLWAERSELREVAGTKVFVDVTAPSPRLVLFGAVDYAAHLCSLARAMGWRAYVVDPRGRFARADRFPDAEEVVPAWPREAFAQIGGIDRATYIAVLTHDPKLDDAALTFALESDAAYIGAMGSRRAQAERRRRLVEAGMPEEALTRIAAPIGLDLGGLTAQETALSIIAEVVAVRNGREGGRLATAGGRIHEVGA